MPPKKSKNRSAVIKKSVTKNIKKCQGKCKRSVSPSFGVRAKKACKLIKKHNIFAGGVCTDCIDQMPSHISSIKYLTDAELVKKLNSVCQKDDKLKTYCNECKHVLLLNKSNIGLYSSKDFERDI